jgi:predicted secreted Zn-dependent protease
MRLFVRLCGDSRKFTASYFFSEKVGILSGIPGLLDASPTLLMKKFRFLALCVLTLVLVCISHPAKHPLSTAESGTAALAASLPAISNIRYQYYSIRGTTAAELRAQMEQRGPVDRMERRRYDARTDWMLRWSYRYVRTGNQCTLRSITSQVNVTLIYPKWQPQSNVSRSLLTDWNRYITALQVHEEGHKDHGIAAGRDIVKKLSQLPPYPSCQELGKAANALAQSISKSYNQRDVDYDSTTRHGYTQGAVFPGVVNASQ